MRLGKATGGAGVAVGWFSERSWENVVIKFVNLWGGPRSGSQLNLCAAGKRLAHNSSTDEQRADPSTAEAKAHGFLPTWRIVRGMTKKVRGQTWVSLLLLLRLCRLLLPPPRLPLSSWPVYGHTSVSLHADCLLALSFTPASKNIAFHITTFFFWGSKWNIRASLQILSPSKK